MSADFTDNSEKIQCFVKCYLQKLGFIDNFGNVKAKVAISALSADGDRAKVSSDVNKCTKEKGNSVCEIAYKVYKCYISNKLNKN